MTLYQMVDVISQVFIFKSWYLFSYTCVGPVCQHSVNQPHNISATNQINCVLTECCEWNATDSGHDYVIFACAWFMSQYIKGQFST